MDIEMAFNYYRCFTRILRLRFWTNQTFQTAVNYSNAVVFPPESSESLQWRLEGGELKKKNNKKIISECFEVQIRSKHIKQYKKNRLHYYRKTGVIKKYEFFWIKVINLVKVMV